MESGKIVEEGYDKIAQEYCEWRRRFDNRNEFEELAALLPNHARVLDVGCGAGLQPDAHSKVRQETDHSYTGNTMEIMAATI